MLRLFVTEPGDGTVDDGVGAGAGTQTPDGFVPQVDYDRLEAQRREFQANLDRTTQENDRLVRELAERPATSPDPVVGAAAGFDPAAFRRELLQDFHSVTALKDAAVAARSDYPHADPALFDRLAEFSSPEAFRLACEVSHTRVADVIATQVADREKTVREEMAKQHGLTLVPPAGAEGVPGDPTQAQLAAMPIHEWDALELKSPGVIDRVLRSG